MGSESLRPQAEDFPSSHVPGDPLVTFPSLGKSLATRRWRNILNTKQRFRRCGGEFLLQRCKRNQKIAGDMARRKVFGLRPQAFARHFPGPLVLWGSISAALAVAAGAETS